LKVIVTGGAGFIGSHICERYASEGHEVIAIDNLARSQMLAIPQEIQKLTFYNRDLLKRYTRIKLVEEDVRNLNSMQELLKNADLIFHTAGQVAVTTSITDPHLDFYINAVGTLNICEAARKNADNAPIIFCSTNKVYGDLNLPIIELPNKYAYNGIAGISEIYPREANCPYGCSKISAETILQSYFETYGLPTIRPRLSCIYGTRQLGCEDQAWVAHFTVSALTKKPITIYGDGKQVRDILFVSDLVRAFALLARESEKTKGEVFNIGGGKENSFSLLEMVELLEKLTLSKIKTKFSEWREGDQKIYVSDTSKINKTLDWKPTVSAQEGISKMVDWYRANLFS